MYGPTHNNKRGRSLLPIPPRAQIERGKEGVKGPQSIRQLDSDSALELRTAYGYIGPIRKIVKSRNADTPFAMQVAAKLFHPIDPDGSQPVDYTRTDSARVVSCRVGCFSRNFTP